MPHKFKGPGPVTVLDDRKIRNFFASGVSGAELARNPNLHIAVANTLFTGIRSGVLGREAAESFNTEQERLRRDFVDAEVLRRFGPQGVTSTTATQPGFRQVTSADRDEISKAFLTPIEQFLAHKSGAQSTGPTPNTVSAPEAVIQRPQLSAGTSGTPARQRTLISGQGVQRRRPARGAAASTLLTSDADEPIGGGTLLG